MSIKLRLILLSLISLLFVFVLGSVGLWNEREMSGAVQKNLAGASMMRNHMQADMMHDALRGDVLSAALAGMLKQADKRKEIEKEMAEHIKTFRDALKENEELSLESNIIQSLQKVRPSIDSYISQCQSMITLAFEKPDEIEAKLPKFMGDFGKLEKEMEGLSDLIEKNLPRQLQQQRIVPLVLKKSSSVRSWWRC